MMGLQMVLGIRRRSVNPAQELSFGLTYMGQLGQLRMHSLQMEYWDSFGLTYMLKPRGLIDQIGLDRLINA